MKHIKLFEEYNSPLTLIRGEGKNDSGNVDLFGKGLYLTDDLNVAKFYGDTIKEFVIEGKIYDDMKSKKVGDIITREKLYTYLEALHDFDFDNEFIEEYLWKHSKYKLVELNIHEIGLDSTSKGLVNDYIEIYKKTNWYPPIFYSLEDEIIIDGYHRAKMINTIGEKKILAWVEFS